MIFPTTIPEDEIDLRIKEWEICGYIVAGALTVVKDTCKRSFTRTYIGIGEQEHKPTKPRKGRTSSGKWYTDHGHSGVKWLYCYKKKPDGSWEAGHLYEAKYQLDVQARKQIVPTNRPTK